MEDTFHLGIKALIRNDSGQILLLKVNIKKLIGVDKEYWDLPGGRKKRSDSIEETLKKEIEEEIGISELENITEVAMVLSNIRIPIGDSDVGLILGIFNCKTKDNAKIRLSGEHIEFKWFTPAEASELLKVKYPESFTNKISVL